MWTLVAGSVGDGDLFTVFIFGALVLLPHVLVAYWALSVFIKPPPHPRKLPTSLPADWTLDGGRHPAPLISLLVLWVSFFFLSLSLPLSLVFLWFLSSLFLDFRSPLCSYLPPLLPLLLLPRPQVLTPQIRR